MSAAPVMHDRSIHGRSPGSTLAGRVVAVIIAVGGPLLMAAHLFVAPWDGGDDIPASMAAILAEPERAEFAILFIGLSAVFGSAGSLIVAASVRRGSPRFGAVAGAIAFAGWVVAAYPGPIAAVAGSAEAGLSADQTAALVAAIDGQVQAAVFGALFVLLPAGILLLGVAALIASRRSSGRRFPRGAAVLLVAAIPIVIVCGLMPGKILAGAWVVVAAAYGISAWVGGRAADGMTAELRDDHAA